MFNCQKILALIDPTLPLQSGLLRAIELAEKNQSQVTAFLGIYDFSYEMTTMLSMDERETMRQAVVDDRTEWLSELIQASNKNDAVSIDIKVVWHHRIYESVIYEVIDNHYDLIVKGTQKHDTLKSVIFTPTDWHLLRKAPVPVLLVKEHDWPEFGNIVAAVNVGVDDEAHISLNNCVAETAKGFASLLKGKVNLVNSFPGTPVNIAIEIPEFDPVSYTESVRKHHEQAMFELANQFAVEPEQCLVNEGLPEDVIPDVANQLDAELVIIGTVGRVGISAALIGNTAEHVIDKLDCDILALKPEGFVCPLTR